MSVFYIVIFIFLTGLSVLYIFIYSSFHSYFGTLIDKLSLCIMQGQSLTFFKQYIKIFFPMCPYLFRHLLYLSPFLHSCICLLELIASSFSISLTKSKLIIFQLY